MSRIDVGQCLQKKLAEAERGYEEATARLAARLDKLDAITGDRYEALTTFVEAQLKFQQYKEANYKSYGAEMASGTGAGDFLEACLVDITRARVAESEKRLSPARQH